MSLQEALVRYDPILTDKVLLEGTLHFPEVEKILPDFYRQLYEKVSLHLFASRHGVKIEPRGKSEELKEMVRDQFLGIEEEIKASFQQIVENDPLWRMGSVRENLHCYQASLENKVEAGDHYQFRLSPGNEGKKIPSAIYFETGKDGKLVRLCVTDRDCSLEAGLETVEAGGRYYFSRMDLVIRRRGAARFRRIEISYGESAGVRYPRKILITELDSQGEPVKASGNLNPVSLIFDAVMVKK